MLDKYTSYLKMQGISYIIQDVLYFSREIIYSIPAEIEEYLYYVGYALHFIVTYIVTEQYNYVQ